MTTPAGWYPDAGNAGTLRFWDGQRWTEATADAEPAVAAAAALLPPPPPPPPAVFPAGPPPLPASGTAPPPRPGRDPKVKKWLVGGAIAAGVVIVGSTGAAIGAASTDGSDAPAARPSASAPAEAPVETPSEEPADAVSEQPEVADPVAFRAQANSHLDDMQKDLDDIVLTVAEDGFWRLLSNSAELAFNQGQLESLDVPASVATAWSGSLAALDAAQTALDDAIETQDGPSILAAVEGVRAQVEAARTVAESAS
ncbi:DUF2510 domain-containing protein [Microbacterium sp. SS28]|uniref:DUF2510 domain-containing protein n=1 Tax=Microbacterium sp. SS28 TaxID=2919948 RepID=UPI001FA94804|nr:DUF2510 domain-containing protein [Microbacterium sp. SS28]